MEIQRKANFWVRCFLPAKIIHFINVWARHLAISNLGPWDLCTHLRCALESISQPATCSAALAKRENFKLHHTAIHMWPSVNLKCLLQGYLSSDTSGNKHTHKRPRISSKKTLNSLQLWTYSDPESSFRNWIKHCRSRIIGGKHKSVQCAYNMRF